MMDHTLTIQSENLQLDATARDIKCNIIFSKFKRIFVYSYVLCCIVCISMATRGCSAPKQYGGMVL